MIWLRRLVAGLSTRRPGFHVGCVEDKVALRQVFLSSSGFPCQYQHSTVALQPHIIWGMNYMSVSGSSSETSSHPIQRKIVHCLLTTDTRK
jgi:hypothetical protein